MNVFYFIEVRKSCFQVWSKAIFYKKRKFIIIIITIIIIIIIIMIIIINIVVTTNSCMFRQVILNMF